MDMTDLNISLDQLIDLSREARFTSRVNYNQSVQQRNDRESNVTKLKVSNLDLNVTNRDMYELFSEFGPLQDASVYYDKNARSHGVAFVIFERKMDAMAAMKQYHGVKLDGRPMVIEHAKSEVLRQRNQLPFDQVPIGALRRGRFSGYREPQVKRLGNGYAGRFHNNNHDEDYLAKKIPLATRQRTVSGITKIIISNLDTAMTDADVYDLFSEIGPLKYCSINYDCHGKSLGSALIIYENAYDTTKAYKLYNGKVLDGRVVDIHFITPGKPNQSRASNQHRERSRRFRRRPKRAPRSENPRKPKENRSRKKTKEELDAELDEYFRDRRQNQA